MNRDPIEENGGLNLYAYLSNNLINLTEFLGMGSQNRGHCHEQQRDPPFSKLAGPFVTYQRSKSKIGFIEAAFSEKNSKTRTERFLQLIIADLKEARQKHHPREPISEP